MTLRLKPKLKFGTTIIDLSNYKCIVDPKWNRERNIHTSVFTQKKTITNKSTLGTGRLLCEIIIIGTDDIIQEIENYTYIDLALYGDESDWIECIVNLNPFASGKKHLIKDSAIITLESRENISNPKTFDLYTSYFNGISSYLDFGDTNFLNFTTELEYVKQTGDTDSHQGIAADPNYIYTLHHDQVYKRNNTSPYASILTNNTILTNVPNANHSGDGVVHNGILYLPIEYYLSGTHNTHTIAKFKTSDLTFIEFYDLDALGGQNHECAGVTTDGNILYVVSYLDGTTIWKYAIEDGEYLGTITLSKTIADIQGLTYKNGQFLLSSSLTNDNGIYLFDADGTFLARIRQDTTSFIFQGIDYTQDDILQIVDEGESEKVYFYKYPDLGWCTGFSVEFDLIWGSNIIDEQAIWSRYEYSTDKRQAYLSFRVKASIPTFEFRIGYLNGTGAIIAEFNDGIFMNTNYKIKGEFDATTQKVNIYIDDILKESVDFPYSMQSFVQDTGVGKLMNTPTTSFLNAKVNSFKIYKKNNTDNWEQIQYVPKLYDGKNIGGSSYHGIPIDIEKVLI